MMLNTFENHEGSVYSVGISPDGSTIVSGGSDRTVKVCDINSGYELTVLKGLKTGFKFLPKVS